MTRSTQGSIQRSALLFAVAAGVGLVQIHQPAASAESNREIAPDENHLLLDDRLIDSVENARLSLGTVRKHPSNPLFGEDLPWEKSLSHMYPNVVFDPVDQRYQAWYYTHRHEQPWSREIAPGPSSPGDEPLAGGGVSICYAESRDGITWTKPELDVVLYQGKPTNIVFDDTHGVGVFRDPRDANPTRRYKAFGSRHSAPPNNEIWVAFSPDGIHWSKRTHVGNARGDTHNNALWAPTIQKYVGITREYPVPPGEHINSPNGIRTVLRMESEDFIKWTEPVEVLRGPRNAQTYSMPVFHYAGLYLGLPAIYRQGVDNRVHTELAWSPDTSVWRRIDEGTPLIPLSETEGHFDWGCIYAAATPIVLDDEIRIYYSGQPGRHGWNPGQLCLATLRPDGWAGYEPRNPAEAAIVRTAPVPCSEETLCVTADARGGAVTVELYDADGNLRARSEPVTGDVTAAAVAWADGFRLSGVTGGRVRLLFRIEKAKIYSFSFRK